MSKGISKTRRREVAERSGGVCEIADCSAPSESIHHIVWRSDGGSNALDNLLDVCQPHHDAFHFVPKETKAQRRARKAAQRDSRPAGGLTHRVKLSGARTPDRRDEEEYRRTVWLRSIDREVEELRSLGIPVVRDRSVTEPPHAWMVRFPWSVYGANGKVIAVAATEAVATQIAQEHRGARAAWFGPG